MQGKEEEKCRYAVMSEDIEGDRTPELLMEEPGDVYQQQFDGMYVQRQAE